MAIDSIKFGLKGFLALVTILCVVSAISKWLSIFFIALLAGELGVVAHSELERSDSGFVRVVGLVAFMLGLGTCFGLLSLIASW